MIFPLINRIYAYHPRILGPIGSGVGGDRECSNIYPTIHYLYVKKTHNKTRLKYLGKTILDTYCNTKGKSMTNAKQWHFNNCRYK